MWGAWPRCFWKTGRILLGLTVSLGIRSNPSVSNLLLINIIVIFSITLSSCCLI